MIKSRENESVFGQQAQGYDHCTLMLQYIVVFCIDLISDDSWDYANPVIISLSKSSVMDMTDARGRLWCAAGNCIYVLDIETLGTEVSIHMSIRRYIEYMCEQFVDA